MSEFQNDEAASPVSSPWIPTLFSRDKKDPPSSLALNEHAPPVDSHFVSPSLPSRGVSSAYHAHEGRITSAAFKESKIGSGGCSGFVHVSVTGFCRDSVVVLCRHPNICAVQCGAHRLFVQIQTESIRNLSMLNCSVEFVQWMCTDAPRC